MSVDVLSEIQAWKQKRHAIILAHNYQPAAVQALADFTGDSLELARKAQHLQEQTVVFCGVTFMAETAAALNPEKFILMPDADAGCPMADMITAEQLNAFKAEHPGAKVLCYVNSSLEVKAESDCCCTSSNALQVAEHYVKQGHEIIFVPDRHLGKYTADRLRTQFHLWPGCCPIHDRFTAADIASARAMHSGVKVMVHPECPQAVRDAADFVLSTGEMCRMALSSSEKALIVGTEIGILYRLQTENPGKVFYPVLDSAICPTMKLTTPESILAALRDLRTAVRVDSLVAAKARRAIEAMLELS